MKRIIRLFSSQKKLQINIKEGSDLSKFIKDSRGHRQSHWQKKSKRQWVACFVVAVIMLNTIYNSFPQSYLTHNLFTKSSNQYVVQAKNQVEARVRTKKQQQQ